MKLFVWGKPAVVVTTWGLHGGEPINWLPYPLGQWARRDATSQLKPCPSVPLSSLLKTSISNGSLEMEKNLLMAARM